MDFWLASLFRNVRKLCPLPAILSTVALRDLRAPPDSMRLCQGLGGGREKGKERPSRIYILIIFFLQIPFSFCLLRERKRGERDIEESASLSNRFLGRGSLKGSTRPQPSPQVLTPPQRPAFEPKISG